MLLGTRAFGWKGLRGLGAKLLTKYHRGYNRRSVCSWSIYPKCSSRLDLATMPGSPDQRSTWPQSTARHTKSTATSKNSNCNTNPVSRCRVPRQTGRNETERNDNQPRTGNLLCRVVLLYVRTCKRNADASQGLRDTSQPAAALTLSSGNAWYIAKAASPNNARKRATRARRERGNGIDIVSRCDARNNPPGAGTQGVRSKHKCSFVRCMELSVHPDSVLFLHESVGSKQR